MPLHGCQLSSGSQIGYALIQPFAESAVVGLVGGAIVALPGKTLRRGARRAQNILYPKYGIASLPYAAANSNST